MGVYYHVKFQLCITSGSKISRGVQNCTHTPECDLIRAPLKRFKYLCFDKSLSSFWWRVMYGTNGIRYRLVSLKHPMGMFLLMPSFSYDVSYSTNSVNF